MERVEGRGALEVQNGFIHNSGIPAGQLGSDMAGPLPTCFLTLQDLAPGSSHGDRRVTCSKRPSPNTRALLQPLFASHLLFSHYPKQVRWARLGSV